MAPTGKTREESRKMIGQAKDNPLDIEEPATMWPVIWGVSKPIEVPGQKGFLESYHVYLLSSNKQLHYGKVSQGHIRTTHADPFHPIDCNL
jgi:hypothetical protein